MANIQNELNNIKTALYGKDVRGSIHDGIDAINKEVESTTGRQVDLENTFDQLVINAGNSNAEIVDARVKNDGTSYSKLGDRLDAVDSQLEQKTSDINSQLEQKASDINTFSSNKVINVKNNVNVAEYINNKIKEGFRTFCISEEIELNEPIIIDNKNVNVQFVGVGVNSHIDCVGSVIKLNTGNIGFKCVNSNNIRFENLSLTTKDCTNKSTIAIMLTREAVGNVYGSSQINMFDNVSILMHDDVRCNNGEGTIGVYANTCEVTNFHNISVTANKPIILTKRDIFKFTNNNYNGSMKDVSFTGYTNLYSYGDTCLIVDGVINLNTNNLYVGEINYDYLDNLYAIEFYDYNTNVNLNVDCEHYKNVIGVFGRLSNSNLSINSLHPNHLIEIGMKRNEKGIFTDNIITCSTTWDNSNTERIEINNSNKGNGIYNSLFLGSVKVKNGSIFENNCLLGNDSKINNVDGAYHSRFTQFKNGELYSNNYRLGFSYVEPTDNTSEPGSIILNANQGGGQGSYVGWVFNGVSFIPFGQVGYKQSAGNPNGSVMPTQIGEELFDNVNNDWYKSTGNSVNDWKKITI